MRQNKFILGLTGSIGTGKSYASKFFKEKGCVTLDADTIAKSLYKKGTSIMDELADNFGSEVLTDDGEVDKKELAVVVFNDKENLEKLNEIVKKYLKIEMDNIIDGLSENEAKPFIVLEAPVLFEYGFEDYVDYILLITADEKTIIKRVMDRDKVNSYEVRARLSSQISQDRKLELSDMCIENSGTVEEFEEKLDLFFQDMKNITKM